MAEDSFKNMLIAFLLIGLFGMLILTTVVEVGTEYGKDTSEVAGGSLSLNKFNQSVTDIEQNAKDMKASFDSGSVWSAIAGVVVNGIFGISKSMFSMILYPFDLVSDIAENIFGVPSYVTSVVLGILIITGIFGVWALIKVGN